MEFTNDIRFNRKPKNNKELRITYTGSLFKSNSDEVYIVYGFGENWENTSEQKMTKTENGFLYNVLMEDYNTFNFCFRNNQYEWDNNNSFNYITSIDQSETESEIQSVDNENAENIVANSIDNIVNDINIDLNQEENTKTIEVADDSEILDALIKELFEEYSSSDSSSTVSEIQNTSESNDLSNIEAEFNNYYNDIENIQANPELEEYKQISSLFDSLIQELEEKTPVQTVAVDIGSELNNAFDNVFNSETTPVTESTETYVPTPEESSSFETENTESENNIFNFESQEFDFSNFLPNTKQDEKTVESSDYSFINNNKFSDSFYDDEYTTEHHTSYNFKSIVENTVSELNAEVSTPTPIADGEFQKQSEEFDKAVSEYAEYFDNLIEEIVSGPVNLATSVSTEEVLQNESTDLAVSENQSSDLQITASSDEGVPEEFALYDYKTQSLLTVVTRRVKLIFSSLFSKLPKLFGRQDNTNE